MSHQQISTILSILYPTQYTNPEHFRHTMVGMQLGILAGGSTATLSGLIAGLAMYLQKGSTISEENDKLYRALLWGSTTTGVVGTIVTPIMGIAGGLIAGRSVKKEESQNTH